MKAKIKPLWFSPEGLEIDTNKTKQISVFAQLAECLPELELVLDLV